MRFHLHRDYDPAVAELLPPSEQRVINFDVGDDAAATGRQLLREGWRYIVVAEPSLIDSHDDPVACLGFIRFISGCEMNGIPVRWALRWSGTAAELAPLMYLRPPSSLVGPWVDERDLEAWRAAWKPTRLFERRGPGFLVVTDQRPGRFVRFTISSEVELKAVDSLRRLSAPTSAADFVRELMAEELVLELSGLYCWLPARLRRSILVIDEPIGTTVSATRSMRRHAIERDRSSN